MEGRENTSSQTDGTAAIDSDPLLNYGFWSDTGTGNTRTVWTSLGTATGAANSTRITGSGFSAAVKVNDTLNLSGSTAPTNGLGRRVVSVISNTVILVDAPLPAALNTEIYRAPLRIDINNDAIIAKFVDNSTTAANAVLEKYIEISSEHQTGTGSHTQSDEDGTISIPTDADIVVGTCLLYTSDAADE